MVSSGILFLFVVGCALFGAARAQGTEPQMLDGTRFEIAFAYVWPGLLVPYPQTHSIHIRSQGRGTVHVQGFRNGSSMNKEFPVEANKTLVIGVTDAEVSTVLGGVVKGGISIRSNTPISVLTSLEYPGNSNVTVHHPVPAWGKTYHTFNYPQDKFVASGKMHHTPGQIVVVSASDSTIVHVRPTARIAKGPYIKKGVEKDEEFSFVLNAHDVVVLVADIDTMAGRSASTDLTGTRISSSRPVAVISGHTKGAVGEYPPLFPVIGPRGTTGAMVRNCFTQSLLPDNLADTAFVTVPLLYGSSRTAETLDTDTAHLGGDVVRVLAISDSTVVKKTRAVGVGYEDVAMLMSGEYYTDYSVKNVSIWATSKPAHVMQYGKSYARVQSSALISGLPTMMIVPGRSRWVNYSSIYAQAGTDNFVNAATPLVLTEKMQSPLAFSFMQIGFSDVAFASMSTPIGEHYLSNGYIGGFMAWHHGSLDGALEGRAFGYPIAVNYGRECDVPIAVDIALKPTTAVVHASLSSECSTILLHRVESSQNMRVDKTLYTDSSITYHMSLVDTNITGRAYVYFRSTGGMTTYRTVELVRTVCTDSISTNVIMASPHATLQASVTATCTAVLTCHPRMVENARVDSTHQNDTTLTVHMTHLDTTLYGAIDVDISSNAGQSASRLIAFAPRTVSTVADNAFLLRNTVPLTLHAQPSSGIVTIYYSMGLHEGGSVQVFDILGRQTMDLSSSLHGRDGSIAVSTAGLARGAYFIHLMSGTETAVTQFLVE